MRTKGRLLIVLAFVVFLLDCQPYRILYADFPAATYDAMNSRYFAVYVKHMSQGSSETSRLCGKFFDSGGALLGNEFVIFESGGRFDRPLISYDRVFGRFLVVWTARDHASSGMVSTYGQLVNANGTSYGSVLTLFEGVNEFDSPAVAYDDDQNVFLALWAEKAALQNSIYGQLIGADGSLMGSKFLVSANAGTSSALSVAYDSGNQRFLAAWSSADNLSVQGRIVYPDGSFLGPEFSLYSGAGIELLPTIAYDGINSRFLAVWEHSEGGAHSLVGQVLNADGTIYQPMFTISAAGLDVNGHALVNDPAGRGYFAVFADDKNRKIYGQSVTVQGTLDTTVSNDNLLLSHQDYPGDYEPTIAYDSADQQFLAGWSYILKDQVYGDIHGRLLNSDGTPSGSIFVLSNGGMW